MILFFISLLAVQTALGSELAAETATPVNCRAQIKKVTCTAPSWDNFPSKNRYKIEIMNIQGYQERKCQASPPRQVSELEAAYDRLPTLVQAAFCHIKRLYIVKGSHEWGARAGVYFDPSQLVTFKDENGTTRLEKKAIGFVLEISEEARFNSIETVEDFTTKVTQGDYGHDTQTDGVSSNLPQAQYKKDGQDFSSLEYTLTHEVGHMLSYANGLTDNNRNENNWNRYSWKFAKSTNNSFTPLLGDEASWQYILRRKTPEAQTKVITQLLAMNGMATQYSLVSPAEDFAETFAIYFYPQLKFYLNSRLIYDIEWESENNGLLRKKLNFISELLRSRTDPYKIESTKK